MPKEIESPDAIIAQLVELLDRTEKERDDAETRLVAGDIDRANLREHLAEASRLLVAALEEQDRLRKNLADVHKTCDRLTELLTNTANALKGEPDELTMHSWHDLPELSKKLRADLKAKGGVADGEES